MAHGEVHGDAAKLLWVVVKTALVTGFSTSTVENSFLARKRVDSDGRRKLSPYKQGNLALLHFESELLNEVNFEQFLTVWTQKRHRLDLRI